MTANRLGLAYARLTALWLLIGGGLALVIRFTHLALGVGVGSEQYPKVVSSHGAVLMYLVALPAMLSRGLALAKPGPDGASPKVSLLDWYGLILYVLACLAMITIGMHGAMGSSWMIIPENLAEVWVSQDEYVKFFMLLFFHAAICMSCAAYLLKRPKTERRSIFNWSVLFCLILLIEGLALMGGAQLVYGIREGTEKAMRAFSMPSPYLMILPALGLLAEHLFGEAQERAPGNRQQTILIAGLAFTFVLGSARMLIWWWSMSSHDYRTDQIAADTTMALLALPVLAHCLVALTTLRRRSSPLRIEEAVAGLSALLLVVAAITGLMVTFGGMEFRSTYFLVAHFHMPLLGGPVCAFLGVIVRLRQRQYPLSTDTLERKGLMLMLLGVAVTFLPLFIGGLLGMFRHVAVMPASFAVFNWVATIGSWILAAGIMLLVYWLFGIPPRRQSVG